MYVDNKSFIEKWVNHRHFFIDEKNLQKLGLTGELISVYSYCMIIPSFQSYFLVLQLVKWWLPVINSVLIAVSNYLTTVKKRLTIFFSKNYALYEISPLDEAKTSIKPLKQQKC